MKIRVNKEKIKYWLRDTSVIFYEPYKAIKEKPFAIITSSVVFYTLGLFFFVTSNTI